MSVLSQIRFIAIPTALLKTVVFIHSCCFNCYFGGCASKPQVNNATRFAQTRLLYSSFRRHAERYCNSLWAELYLCLQNMNDITAPYRIYVGQSLRLKARVAHYNSRRNPITNRSNSTSKCWSPESKYDHHNHNNSC